MKNTRATPFVIILCFIALLPKSNARNLEFPAGTEKNIQAAKVEMLEFLTQVTRIMPAVKEIESSPEDWDMRMDMTLAAGDQVPLPQNILEPASDALAHVLAELSDVVSLTQRDEETAGLPNGEGSQEALDTLSSALAELVDEISNTEQRPTESTVYQLEKNETSTVPPSENYVDPEVLEIVANTLVDLITEISHSRLPSSGTITDQYGSNSADSVLSDRPRPEIGVSPHVLEDVANALIDLVSEVSI